MCTIDFQLRPENSIEKLDTIIKIFVNVSSKITCAKHLLVLLMWIPVFLTKISVEWSILYGSFLSSISLVLFRTKFWWNNKNKFIFCIELTTNFLNENKKEKILSRCAFQTFSIIIILTQIFKTHSSPSENHFKIHTKPSTSNNRHGVKLTLLTLIT